MKKKNKVEGGADWMGTYGDMVTLLLCFFVLLYSISSVDQTKWENLVKSMNPEAAEVSQIVTDELSDSQGTNNIAGGNEAEIDEQFDEMYDNLIDLKEQNPNLSDVEITKGDGYQFISFSDSVFFNGDSYVLLDEGKTVLDAFSGVFSESAEAIAEIQVLGHTSQATPDIPNEVMTDRLLSASRSAVVVAYIQEKSIIDPERLVSLGYGQFRPIASFDTREDRALNRRVEIMITQTGAEIQTLEEYYDQIYEERDNSEADAGEDAAASDTSEETPEE